VLEKKFHILVHTIKVYYLEDVKYIVGGCINLHNMMVELRMHNDERESSSFCELHLMLFQGNTQQHPTAVEASIDDEDTIFKAASAEEYNADFCRQKHDAEVLGHQLMIVQYYWKQLTDMQDNFELILRMKCPEV